MNYQQQMELDREDREVTSKIHTHGIYNESLRILTKLQAILDRYYVHDDLSNTIAPGKNQERLDFLELLRMINIASETTKNLSQALNITQVLFDNIESPELTINPPPNPPIVSPLVEPGEFSINDFLNLITTSLTHHMRQHPEEVADVNVINNLISAVDALNPKLGED